MGEIVAPEELGLTVLHAPWLDGIDVDIIAVHGLGGHPIRSWTHVENHPPGVNNKVKGPDNKAPPSVGTGGQQQTSTSADNSQSPIEEPTTFWLKDLLFCPVSSNFQPEVDPAHLPLLKGGIKKARIRTFGYDSTRAAGEGKTIGDDLIKPVALELLAAVSERVWEQETWGSSSKPSRIPLVFVGMDIGGTIIKEALTIAATSRYYDIVLFKTQLLLFFGVPSHITPDNTYSDLLLDTALSSLSQASNRPYRHDLLSTALKPDVDATFARIESNFSLINTGIRRSVSIFATAPTTAVCNTVVIPQANAVLGGQGGAGGDGWGGCELEIARVGKEHIDIAKFSRQSFEDLEILGMVIELVKETMISWNEHPGWEGPENQWLNPGDYFTLRRAFTPVNWEWYGPLPTATLMENHWKQPNSTGVAIDDLFSPSSFPTYAWLEENEAYKLWYAQDSTSGGDKYGANTPEGKVRKRKASHENDGDSDDNHNDNDDDTDIYGELAEIDAYTFEQENKGGGVLHIYGRSGTGKTVLAQYLLQRLLQNARAALTAAAGPAAATGPAGLPVANPPPPEAPSAAGSTLTEPELDLGSVPAPYTPSKDPPKGFASTGRVQQQRPQPATGTGTGTGILSTTTKKNIGHVRSRGLNKSRKKKITRPIILAYIASPTHHDLVEPFPTATSTHHGAHILATLIAQYLIQDSTSAHILHYLYDGILDRRTPSEYRLAAGLTDDDMWLLFDEMLAARDEREVIIIIDDDYHRRQKHPTGRATNWLIQRLVDRVASGGPEGNGLVKLFVTTQLRRDLIAYPDCKVDGYNYQTISLDIDPNTEPTTAQCMSRKEAINTKLGELLASNTESEKSEVDLLEGVLRKMLLQNRVTWLDLQLASLLPLSCIPEFVNWFEQKETSQDTIDDEDHDGGGGAGDWVLRNKLYQYHYNHYRNKLLINPHSQEIRWATLALGWLLYTPIPLHAGTLAMAISMSQSWGKQAVHSQEQTETMGHRVYKSQKDFAAILLFLNKSLTKTIFLSVIPATGQLHYDSRDGNCAIEESKFIGLRQSDVRKFLLGIHKRGDESLDGDLPNFADAAKWNELMTLTCFDVMEFSEAQNVDLPGENSEYGCYMAYIQSHLVEIPGGDDIGEKFVNEGGAITEDTQRDNDPKENNERDVQKRGSTNAIDEQTKEDGRDETEPTVLDKSRDEDGKEAEAAGSSVDHAEAEETSRHAETVQDANQTENKRGNTTPAVSEEKGTGIHDAEGPIPLPHLPTSSLVVYATLNWPIHARKFYSLTYPTRKGKTPVDIASTKVTSRITAFVSNTNELEKWRHRYIFLSSTTTTTPYPLYSDFCSPIRLAAYFGLLPLLKHFTISLPPDKRDMMERLISIELAAQSGHLDCFQYLFNLHAHLDYDVVHVLPSLERAGKTGAIDIVKELLTGNHSKKIKMLLRDVPSSERWNYSEVISIAAKNGQNEILEFLLDHMPEGTYNRCGFVPLIKAKGEEKVGDKDEAIEHKGVADDLAVSSQKESQDSPLHSACKAGFTATVKYLLNRTACDFPRIDPCKADSQGFTPLHHAAGEGVLGTTKLLLTYPAVDVDTADWAIKPLHLAAEKGFHLIVQELLRKNANVDVIDDTGRNPLHRACVQCFIHVVRQLLMQGLDANQGDSEGFTPLHLAANRGNSEVLDLLISHGAEPDPKVTATGNTPLHYAATKGFEQIVRKLLDCGATVTGKLVDNECTPLHLAAYHGHVEICRMLVESGADPHLIAKQNDFLFLQTGDWTMLLLCLGNPELTRMFIDMGVDVHYQDHNGDTALTVSASSQGWDAVKMLIQAGAVVKDIGKNSTKGPPLHSAVMNFKPDIARLLLEHGADVNFVPRSDNRMPIHVATTHSTNYELLDTLFEFGADPNGFGEANSNAISSPLYNAAYQGDDTLVKYLLDHGAKPNLPTGEGQYDHAPLTVAAQYGYKNILDLLLEKGALVDQISNGEGGFTALYMACTNGHVECAKVLLKDGKGSPDIPTVQSGWTALHAAAAGGYEECISLLLDHGGVDINRLTKDNKSTAIWLAANGYYCEVVKLLLGGGADAALVSNDGNSTPLHAAASKGYTDIVRILLESPSVLAGINGMYGEFGDSTALHAACASGYTEVVKLLLDHGADPTTRPDPPTTEIRSCLNAAALVGHIETVKLLLEHPAQVKEINALSGPYKNTALHASTDYPEIVRLLLEHGGDPTIPSNDGTTLLHHIAAGGDLDLLNDLIHKYHLPVNSVTEDGNTPAYMAVEATSNDHVKILIEAGAITTPGALDETHGWSLLQNAAYFNRLEKARLLLSYPSVVEDIDYQNKKGGWTTALHQTASGGSVQVARLLLDYGASIDIQTSVDFEENAPQTPLATAAFNRQFGPMKLFLEHGADVNGVQLYDGYPDSPLVLAADQETAFLEGCKLLLNWGADVDGCAVKSDQTPLAIAALRGSLDVCKLLLERGANVNGTSSAVLGARIRTPLHIAAEYGHVDICKLLLKNGAIETNWDETPLSVAAGGGHTACVEVLLEHGYHVDNHKNGTRRKNKDGSYQRTPLLEAVISGHSEVLALLLKHGADPNVLDSESLTPLHLACEWNHAECVKLLLQQSTVDPNHGDIQLNKCPKGGDGRTPLFMAVKGNSHECVELLLKAGVNPNSGSLDRFGWTALAHAAASSYQNCLRLLIEAGGDVNQVSRSGHNLLAHASRSISPDAKECVEYLLEKGAKVDGSDPRGIPLLEAYLGSSADILSILAKNGANMTPTGPSLGRTPIFYAAQAQIDVLNSFGDEIFKNINARDHRERTPLFYAAARGTVDVLQLLLEKGADKTVTDVIGRTILDVVEPSEQSQEIRQLLAGSSDGVKIVKDANGNNCDMYCDHTKHDSIFGLRECDRCKKPLDAPQYFLHCCRCKEGHDICVDCFVNKGERCPDITAWGEGGLMFGDHGLYSHIAFSSAWMEEGRLGPLGKIDPVCVKAREILREIFEEEKRKKKEEQEKEAEENKEKEEKKEKARKKQEEWNGQYRKNKVKAEAGSQEEIIKEKKGEEDNEQKQGQGQEKQIGHQTETEKHKEKDERDMNTKYLDPEHSKPESAEKVPSGGEDSRSEGDDKDGPLRIGGDTKDDEGTPENNPQVVNVDESGYAIGESAGDMDVEIEEIEMDDDDD